MKKILTVLMAFFLTFANAADFLMPEEAFKPYAKLSEKMQIEAGVNLGKDIYLYADKMAFEIVEPKGVSVEMVEQSQSVLHHEEQVYLESPAFVLALQAKEPLSGMQSVKLLISYQGCSEEGLCYEPSQKEFAFEVDGSKLAVKNAAQTPQMQQTTTPQTQAKELSQTDAIADTIQSSNLLIMMLTFLGFGLLLSLTPCVFPMVPIISGVIISQGEGLTTKRAFFLSVVYVLAMAVAYTIAGVLAGLFGSNLQAALQTPWVIYSFAGVFVVLAMSMFGFYELKLPDAIVNRVSQNSNRGGALGVAIMGFLSALIVGPCVAAPLAGALVYIGQTGDALLGGAALFSMSIGMGIPLIIVGVSAGKFMPKPGEWMTMVTAIFGIMMLGVAIWMLDRVVSSDTILLLSAFLGLGTAIYLGAFKEGHVFKRTIAIIIFIYSLALFMSYLAGASSLSKPLAFLKSSGVSVAQEQKHLAFESVHSVEELNALLEKYKGKKIMLDFAADWCVACKELDAITFSDAAVQNALSEYVLIRADVTKNTPEEKALSKAYGVFGPPVLLFFDTESKLLASKSIVGFIEPAAFLKHLESL